MKGIRYAAEVHEFIRSNYKDYTQEELAVICNEKFGTDFDRKKMKTYFANHKLRAVKRQRPVSKLYPVEVREFIAANIKGVHFADMAIMLNEKFGTSYSYGQIRAYCKNHKLPNGVDCRLKPGNVPFTKGKKWDEFLSKEHQENLKKTCYKKGSKPFNAMQIGETSVTTDGFLIVKVSDEGHQWERWKFLHRQVWEEHHGPIPAGMMVIFKDGNKANCSIENLMLVSRSENGVLNMKKLRSENPEITQARVSIMRIKRKVQNVKKKKHSSGGDVHGANDHHGNGGHDTAGRSSGTGTERMEEEL